MTLKKEMLRRLEINNNPQDIKFIIPGIIAEIIFNKEFFKKNSELKQFTGIFDNIYADYLFNARPLLYSRLIKEFKSIENDRELKIYVNKVIVFLNSDDDKQKVNVRKKISRTKNSTTKSIESWGKIINPGRYNED